MRVAALYDVHGNLPALDAVLGDARLAAADVIVSGGDLVAGPFPAECLDRLLALGSRVRFVHGNADRAAAEWDDEWARWCRAELGKERIERIREWPRTERIEIDGLGSALFCHSTPRSDEEIVTRSTPVDEVIEALAGTEADVVVNGHVHVQSDRAIYGTRLVCAGSVGMPYEGRPGAYWALLGPDVEHVRTEYDVDSAAALARGTGYASREDLATVLLSPPGADEASAHFEALRRG